MKYSFCSFVCGVPYKKEHSGLYTLPAKRYGGGEHYGL